MPSGKTASDETAVSGRRHLPDAGPGDPIDRRGRAAARLEEFQFAGFRAELFQQRGRAVRRLAEPTSRAGRARPGCCRSIAGARTGDARRGQPLSATNPDQDGDNRADDPRPSCLVPLHV